MHKAIVSRPFAPAVETKRSICDVQLMVSAPVFRTVSELDVAEVRLAILGLANPTEARCFDQRRLVVPGRTQLEAE